MNNKPKYNFFKNSKYALEGFIHAFKTESSFRIEMFLSIFITIAIIVVDTSITNKLILVISGTIVLIVELLNSSIENVVDLVTKEFKPLAKSSKDIAATAVAFSIILHLSCWVIILLN
jgi:diacylglycerol kinase (ATP)